MKSATASPTPGPWHLVGTLHPYLTSETPKVSSERSVICELRSNGEVGYANARLIAAAPDLLATLKETRDAASALMRAIVMLDEPIVTAIMDMVGSKYDGFGARADAAIARAEGRS